MTKPQLLEELQKLTLNIMTHSDGVPDGVPYPVSHQSLLDWQNKLVDISHELEQNYVRLETTGAVPTVAQGVGLAHLLRSSLEHGSALVMRGGVMGLGNHYLAVRFTDGYEAGIDPSGQVTT